MKIKLKDLTLGLAQRICRELPCTEISLNCPLRQCKICSGVAKPRILCMDLNQEIEIPKMEFVRGYFTCNGKTRGYWRTRR